MRRRHHKADAFAFISDGDEGAVDVRGVHALCQKKTRKTPRLFDGAALACATIISLGNSIAGCFDAGATPLLQNEIDIAYVGYLAGKTVLVAAAIYVVVFLLYRHYESVVEKSDKRIAPLNREHMFAYATVMLACWLPWIVFHYPGTIRDDTFPQLLQWRGVVGYFDQHPILDTLVFGVFWSLGSCLSDPEAGLFIYLVAQAICTSLLLAYSLAYIERFGICRPLLLGMLAFLCLSRAIYQPVDAMSKDSFNAIFAIPATILVFEIVRTEGGCLTAKSSFVWAIIILFLTIASKRIALYVFPPALLVALFFLRKRRSFLRVLTTALLPVVLLEIVFSPFLAAMLGVRHVTTYEIWSVPLQQIVATLKEHPDSLNADELAELGLILDVDEATENYVAYRSDEVIHCLTDSFSAPILLKYWAELGLRYPSSYLVAYGNLAAGWFSLTNSLDYGHNSSIELFENDEHIWIWVDSFFDGDVSAYESVIADYNFDKPAEFEGVCSLLEEADSFQKEVLPLFSSPGFVCIAPFVTAFCFCVSRRRMLRGWAVMLLVPLLLIAILLVGSLVLYWYSLPLAYLAPLILATPFVCGSPDAAMKTLRNERRLKRSATFPC